MNMHGWWYAFVTAAPLPEAGEAVNVAILTGNGALDRLTYEPGLPRLEGMVRREQREVFQAVLERASHEVRNGMDLPALKAAIGPQLTISEPIALRVRPSASIMGVLRRQYLTGTRVDVSTESKKLVKKSLERLDNALSATAHIAMWDIRRRPEPRSLYPDTPPLAQANIPRLGRVVRGPDRDLLIDAVLLSPGKGTLAIRSATERIGRAFWYYDQLRAEIERNEHRSIRLVGVLAWEDGRNGDRDLKDAASYIEEGWARHAEVVPSDDRTGLDRLRVHVNWLAGDSSW